MSDQVQRASKTVLPKLYLAQPYASSGKYDAQVVLNDPLTGQEVTYCQRNTTEFNVALYHHFPVVLTVDGSPWRHAVLYLLHKLEAINLPNSKTLESIASDLVMFRRYIDKNGIDYLDFPKRKLRRPTYRYRAELQHMICGSDISPNTASRRMSSVIGFYRWLESQFDTNFDYPLWQDKEMFITFLDYKGFSQSKPVRSTDLAVPIPNKQCDDYSEFIQDGGKLRPLSRKEQLALVNSLKNIGNPEMTLAFLLALTTGARAQTVFTLRLKHILVEVADGQNEVSVYVGMGTAVDTKYQKRMTIFIPLWLHNRLKVYVNSERAQRRRDLTKHQFDSSQDQYAFLTRNGTPYYIADSDPLLRIYRHPPRGVSVRKFIKAYLEPELARLGTNLKFRFHDLRATFGLNLLEDKLSLVQRGNVKLFDVLMHVRNRMGHSHLSTTERYLEFRKKYDLAISTQSEFEQHLMRLVEEGADDA